MTDSDADVQPPLRKARYIEEFFAKYEDFTFDTTKPSMAEFHRLCQERGWEDDSGRVRQARHKLKKALIEQFSNFYGKNIGDINSWKSLCRVLRISPIPSGVPECQKIVRVTHANLVDLVDAQRVQMTVDTFSTVQELEAYTMREDKYFPKYVASSHLLLRWLLRPLRKPQGRPVQENSSEGAKEGGTGKKRKRRRRRKKKEAPAVPQ